MSMSRKNSTGIDFDAAFEILIGHEGSYSDHSADPGGKTRYGVTERVARANGYTGDMRDLPLDFAKGVYRRSYWDAVRADDLPESIRFHVFDAAVNSGPVQAAKWLQQAAGVATDGKIGPQTIGAAGKVTPAHYSAIRLRFMTGLPTWKDFGKGWARRICDNLEIKP